MFVIKNDAGQYYSGRIDGEFGDGWGCDAQIFTSYKEAVETIVYKAWLYRWIYEVKLHTT